MQPDKLNNNLKAALASDHKIDVAPAILSRIRDGQLQIMPKKNTTLVRFLGWTSLAASILLNIFALYYVVQNILTEQTLSFLQITFADFSSLAWAAFLESIPWLTLGFFVLALLDLTLVVRLRSRFIKNNFLTR